MFPRRGKGQSVAETLYVEDVFSAFTHIGTGAAKSIVNGVNLLERGGMVWHKRRDISASHIICDSARGSTKILIPDSANAEATVAFGVTGFNVDGFNLGVDTNYNTSAASYASWSFRKAARFFDVVTYTGNGANRTIAHNLGVAPGMIFFKRVDSVGSWRVHHRSIGATSFLDLSISNGVQTDATFLNSTLPTSADFTLGTSGAANAAGGTYVAYLFAHDSASDGIIQCGTLTTDGSGNATINLGWEAQYILVKNSAGVSNWHILDTSRGWDIKATDLPLFANASTAEASTSYGNPTATGASIILPNASSAHIYMAIRKGLMRTPTDATKVFEPVARTGNGAAATISLSGIKTGPELIIAKRRNSTTAHFWSDKIRGPGLHLSSDSTAAEVASASGVTSFNMDGVSVSTLGGVNGNTQPYINYFFKQARGFCDIVAYTGTGVAHTESHNLGAVPELIIVKSRSGAVAWPVYYGDPTKVMELNTTAAAAISNVRWNDTAPTDTVFTVGTNNSVNAVAATYIAYLFATVPGVSKIGTYTGTGAAQNIDCGFAAGARFVLAKRIDSTGDWYYWDSTRGIISGNDPYLLINSTAAEVTSTDYIEPYSAGFALDATAPAALNASGGTFLFLAIA